MIADLVMNHTSIDHPWFQESRSGGRDQITPSATGTCGRTPSHRYEDARIIFIDTETSNWTWDDTAGAYYWHRFFSHQPDLNYDNPEVQEAMLDVLRFWLDLGLDGFRLDAVPYLFEREGTNCENLPETHAYLKRVRKEVDDNYPDRVLLAEANQWPADVVAVLRRRRRVPDGLPLPGDAADVHGDSARGGGADLRDPRADADDPRRAASGGCSCATTTSSRSRWSPTRSGDYMYTEYAKDPRMKLNLGIRRRLAPLLDNGRDEIELMHAIMFSLPGVARPVLRRRDRDGRQRVPRRPRRRPDADAVDRATATAASAARTSPSSTRRR